MATVVVAISAIGFTWAIHRLFEYPYEDAFIHFRFARNLAESGQPYFNANERVFGDSSPLWMLILATGFSLLGTGSYRFVAALASVPVVASLVLAYRLVARDERWSIASACGAAAAAATLVSSAGGGMETPLAMALLTAACLAVKGERWATAGALIAFAGATRFELFPVAVIALLIAPGARRLRYAAAFGVVAGLEAVLLFAAYRTLVPNTMIAKAIVFNLSPAEFWARLPAPWGVSPVVFLWALCLPAFAAGVASLFALRNRAMTAADSRSLVVLGALPAVLATVYALTKPMLYHWYWPLTVYPALLGVLFVGMRAPAAWAANPPGPTRWIGAVAFAALCAAPILMGWMTVVDAAEDTYASVSGRLGASSRLTPNARARTYLEIGSDLEERCGGVTVLAAEVGALGWTYRGKIIDGVGLVSPEVLKYHPLRAPDERADSAVGAYPARAVAELRPEVIVAMQVFNSDFARKRPFDPTLAAYSVIDARPVFSPSLSQQGMPARLWGSTHVIVLGQPERCSLRR